MVEWLGHLPVDPLVGCSQGVLIVCLLAALRSSGYVTCCLLGGLLRDASLTQRHVHSAPRCSVTCRSHDSSHNMRVATTKTCDAHDSSHIKDA